jgi:hypothetical protein
MEGGLAKINKLNYRNMIKGDKKMKKYGIFLILVIVSMMLSIPLMQAQTELKSTEIEDEKIVPDKVKATATRYKITGIAIASTYGVYGVKEHERIPIDEFKPWFAKITGEVSWLPETLPLYPATIILEDHEDYITISPLFKNEITFSMKDFVNDYDHLEIYTLLPFFLRIQEIE